MTDAPDLPGLAPRQDPDPIILRQRPLRSAIRYLGRLADDPRYDFMTNDQWLRLLRGLVEAHEDPHDEPHPGDPDAL